MSEFLKKREFSCLNLQWEGCAWTTEE